ncbi:MAG: phosphoglycerate dehydrogenase [Acidaminococcaceae bacterium]|jgi:D-3-phosphoglycerate dehydrogenase|nr:phosphoglycerate dehydrogenase [Acidaminococcaceae bacterium]
MKKVLVTEKISDKGVALLKAQKDLQVDVEMDLTREELLKKIPAYECIVVRSVTKINEEFYKHATNLKVVGRAGNGVDNIEMEGATKRGVIVVNTPESNIISACEHTIGLMLSSCRNTVRAHKMIESRVWDRNGLKGTELYGKTLGIIGLGRIGGLLAIRMHAFGMKIIAFDPYIADARFKKYNVEKCETLDDLLKAADVISIHTPKTAETMNMITYKEWKKCKKGVRVVNCARGGLYNEQDLAKAIKEGIVASAGIDVLVDEPKPISPLIDLPQCVLTPHLGADTTEAQDNVGIAIAEEVIAALRGEMVPNAVNLPALGADELAAVQDYLTLAEDLGKLYYQLHREAVEKVEVIYSGKLAEMETDMITRAAMKGVLEPVLMEHVNYVNALIAADHRGIAITESKENGDQDLLTVKVITKKGEFVASGRVLGRGQVRIAEIDGYQFDVEPTPYMLVANNEDKPGMIGQIGTLLGASKVNIATMQVSRNQKNGIAMMFLTVDSDVPADVLKLLKNVGGITKVNMVKI